MTERSDRHGDSPIENLTAKARRTRARLTNAARTVFERDGFLNARVMDIAVEAGVAHGTFYTYFDSKTDIFRAVLSEFMPRIYEPGGKGEPITRIQRLERGNDQFYTVYLTNLRLMALLEQAATFDDEVRTLRIQLRQRAESSVLGLVKRQQERGELDPKLDPSIVASSLIAMTTHSFYTWHVPEDRQYDVTLANRTLTYLWAKALGMVAEPEDDEFYQSLRPAPVRKRAGSARKTPPKSSKAR